VALCVLFYLSGLIWLINYISTLLFISALKETPRKAPIENLSIE
jgi:hypothetical protein